MRSRKIPSSVIIVFGGVLLLILVYLYFTQFAHVPAEKPQAGATEHVTLTPLPPTPSATFIPPLVVHRATVESEEHFAQILPDCINDFALFFDNNIPTLEDQDGVIIFCQNGPGVKPNKQAWHGQVNSDNQIEYSPLDMAPMESAEGAFILYESLKPGQTDSNRILEWNPELTLDGKKDGPKYIAYNHTGETGNEQKYVIPDSDSQSQNINSVLASVNPPEPEKHPDRITLLLTTYNPPHTDIKINIPTTIIVSIPLYERKDHPWHTVTARPNYKSNENGEDGASAMAHTFLAALHYAHIYDGSTENYNQYIKMVQEAQALQRPFSDVAVNIVAYNDDDPQKSESLDLYKIFPTSVTYLIINGTGTSLKKGGEVHIQNYEKANQTADLIIEIPVEIKYDMRVGGYITGQINKALTRLAQLPLEVDDFNAPLGIIAFGPKTPIKIPGSSETYYYYPAPLDVVPHNPSSSSLP